MIAALRRVLPLAFFIAGCAAAQPAAAECYGTGADKAPACQTVPSFLDDNGNPVSVSAGNPMPTSAEVSASIAVDGQSSTNLSSTIATTNTFQSIQVSTAGRKGCLIQNQSTTNAMWVFFGAIGSATKAKSFILDTSHGLSISCAVGGIGVVTDQVSITGTSADAFAANFQ